MKVLVFLNFVFAASVVAFSPEENLYTRDDELFEGDMKLLPDQARGSVPGRLWPNGKFVYEISPELKSSARAMNAIYAAFEAWKTKTNGCIQFKERSDEQAYVKFFEGSGCWSYVGRTGREQQLSLAGGCWRKGTVAHEIGHALGFLHEQSRPDRDNFVEIKFENIREGMEHNFQKSSSVNLLGTPYDYGSIMHYGERYFTKNGKPTIVAKKPGVTIGQRFSISPIDAQQMTLLYKSHSQCASVTPPPTAPLPSSTSFLCNFDDDDCGFKQSINDKFDWSRKRGPTPSGGTGPKRDHTSGQGSYMFIEASSPRKKGDNAKMSRVVTLSGNSCLRFYYHMFGSSMGTLKVTLRNKEIFTKTGNQGNDWKMYQDRLPGTGSKTLTFEGIRGSSYTGDASIDDITIFDC